MNTKLINSFAKSVSNEDSGNVVTFLTFTTVGGEGGWYYFAVYVSLY